MHRSAVEHESRCPLWVKSEHHGAFDQCLLYPRKQTLELSHGMSALCQKRTSRLHALWNKSANSHLDFMALRKLEPSELHRQEEGYTVAICEAVAANNNLISTRAGAIRWIDEDRQVLS